MSQLIKEFVANYLSSFLKKDIVEAKFSVSDTEHKSVVKPFVEPVRKVTPAVPPGTFDNIKAKEFESGLKASGETGKVSHYSKEAPRPFEKMKPTGRAGPYVGQTTDTKKKNIVTQGKETAADAAVASRKQDSTEYDRLSRHAAEAKDSSKNYGQRKQAKRFLVRAAERTSGSKPFERKGEIAAPGKEQFQVVAPKKGETEAERVSRFLPGLEHPSGTTKTHTNPNDLHTKITHKFKRSQGTGRSVIDPNTEKTVTTQLKHGDRTLSVSPKSTNPNIRVDLPARPHPYIDNAVTKALVKATNSGWKKDLLSRQAKVPKDEV